MIKVCAVFIWISFVIPIGVNAEQLVRTEDSVAKVQSNELPPAMSCGDLTDNACKKLWEKGKGGMPLRDGEVLPWLSSRSTFARVKIEDLKALIDSEPNLSNDLREALSPHFKSLKKSLENERDARDWYREIAILDFQIKNAIKDVAAQRVEKAHPHLADIKQADLNFDQKALYSAAEYEAADEVLEAKYDKHPNWVRVKKVFSSVKADMHKAVDALKIPEEQKQIMKERIRTVKLSLPYTDPRKLGAREDCGTSAINASYYPSWHTFTYCAGYFNRFQSESQIYVVMAHEIGHSIDPARMGHLNCNHKSHVANALKPLIGSREPALKCDVWQKVKKDLLAAGKESFQPVKSPLQDLYDCLESKKSLKPLTNENVDAAVDAIVRDEISAYASANQFLRLAQPTLTKEGKTLPNEYYMRPDRLMSSDNLQADKPHPYLNPIDIFNQEINCASLEKNGEKISYKDAPKDVRAQIFDDAVAVTRDLVRVNTKDALKYCGTDCNSLSRYGLARPSNENFADWISGRAFSHHLARTSDVNERRELASSAFAMLCARPGVLNDAPDLALAEKKYSLAVHPDDRVRRVSVFNPRTADLVNCNVLDNDKGFSQCEP